MLFNLSCLLLHHLSSLRHGTHKALLVWNKVKSDMFLECALNSVQACVSQKTRKLLGPGDFWGLFSGEFLGSRVSTRPKTPRILTRVFRVVFSGLQRELGSDLFKNLNWHGCTELGSSCTLQIKPSFVKSLRNFWLFLHLYSFNTAYCTLIDC